MLNKTKILFSTSLTLCATLPLAVSCSSKEKWNLTWDYIKDQTTRHFIPSIPESQRPTDNLESFSLVTPFYFNAISQNNTIFTDDFFTYYDSILSTFQTEKGNYAKASISIKSIDAEKQTMSFKFCIEANIEHDAFRSKLYYKTRFEWTNFKFEVSPYISDFQIKWWYLEPSDDIDWLMQHNDWRFDYNIQETVSGITTKDSGTVTKDSGSYAKLDEYVDLSSFDLWYLDLIQTPEPNYRK